MSLISSNLEEVNARIAAAAESVGRTREDITLVAVTKTKPCSDIKEAAAAGAAEFGENYVQELVSKYDELGAVGNWHMIGHLQRNKVKYIAPFVSMIQSVDSAALAEEISRRALAAGRRIDILIEAKVSEEDTKTGMNPDEARDLALAANDLPGVAVRGIMGIPPFGADPRPYFERLKKIYDSLPKEMGKYLSMGMTSDYETAIAFGSNMVRVGTAIFGARDYGKQ